MPASAAVSSSVQVPLRLLASSCALASSHVLLETSGTVETVFFLATVRVIGAPLLHLVAGRRVLVEDGAGVSALDSFDSVLTTNW